MSRMIGTIARGIRTPIFREGDDIVSITVDTVWKALKENNIEAKDKDVVAITESVVARCQGNYATIDDIAKDVKEKTGGGKVGVIFPIMSRNRFSLLLTGIAKACDEVVVMFSYPNDEVGNPLVTIEAIEEAGINPYLDTLTEEQFRKYFGYPLHPFTGMDYVAFYRELIENVGTKAKIVFANRPQAILEYTDKVICADIHTRFRNKKKMKEAGAKVVLGLDDILNKSVDGCGFNEQYGLLGSNKADEERIKLFPRNTMEIAKEISEGLSKLSGKHIEAMIYGDGAFKDPAAKIWELADPVVSPGYTNGLIGTPNELKLKYLADKEFIDLNGDELQKAITQKIREKDEKTSLVGKMISEGTTPRNLTDLLGSLSDLTSGSGDKGTPVVYIQGYFDNYTNE